MRLPLMLIVWSLAMLAHGQSVGQTRATAKADSILDVMRNTLARDPATTITTTSDLIRAYAKAGDRCKLAEVNCFRSTSYSELGVLDSAMACAHRAIGGFEAGCDSIILVRGYVAMSKLRLTLGEMQACDSACTVGLGLWRAHYTNTVLRNALLTNKAIASALQGDLDGAKVNFRTILNFAQQEGNVQDMDDARGNLGAVMSMTGDLDSAAYFYDLVLSSARANNKTGRIAIQFSNLAALARRRNDNASAIRLSDSALFYAERAKDLPLQIKIHGLMAQDLHVMGRDGAAYDHSLLQFQLNDSMLNAEKVHSLAEMREKYESEKKAREILSLRADNLSVELDKARVTRTRNIYLFSGLGVVGLALGLWSRLRYIYRSRTAIQKEKDISEGLLLNILPEEVAAELKVKGEAEARLIEQVTVLFTDFKGFTAISEQLSPKALVRDIHECFSAFDRIMEKYGIEKIKTIGDAYMAAGGLPTVNDTHAEDVVKAAFEIDAFMTEGKALKIAGGLPYFEVRIGIHTGPVVAGIVGVKKFAYDIWGDTVNTASRMESSGEVGKVNISETTYDRIKDNPAFKFTPRGLVAAKGKGNMHMYFVEKA